MSRPLPVRRNEDGSIYLSYDYLKFVNGIPVKLMFAEAEGKIVCTRVEVGAPFERPGPDHAHPITTGVWRDIPVTGLVDEALLQLARGFRASAERSKTLYGQARSGTNPKARIAEGYTDEMFDTAQSRMLGVAAAAEAAIRKPGRPPKYDDGHWKEVLEVYRRHGGRSPRKAVAEHFGIKLKLAGKWVKKATLREQEAAKSRARNP